MLKVLNYWIYRRAKKIITLPDLREVANREENKKKPQLVRAIEAIQSGKAGLVSSPSAGYQPSGPWTVKRHLTREQVADKHKFEMMCEPAIKKWIAQQRADDPFKSLQEVSDEVLRQRVVDNIRQKIQSKWIKKYQGDKFEPSREDMNMACKMTEPELKHALKTLYMTERGFLAYPNPDKLPSPRLPSPRLSLRGYY